MTMTKGFKEKVRKTAIKQKEKSRDERNKYYKALYNRKEIITLPKPSINMEKFFYFPKSYFQEINISKPAVALYPVLCSLADYKKEKFFQISIKNLGVYAGLSEPQVIKGIKDLQNIKMNNGKALLEIKQIQRKERRLNTYNIKFDRRGKDEGKSCSFPFHVCIIDSGIWAKLPSACKAVYLSLRINSEWAEWAENGKEALEEYKARDYEVYAGSLQRIADNAGLSYPTTLKWMGMLDDYGLIAEFEIGKHRKVLEVYLKASV